MTSLSFSDKTNIFLNLYGSALFLLICNSIGTLGSEAGRDVLLCFFGLGLEDGVILRSSLLFTFQAYIVLNTSWPNTTKVGMHSNIILDLVFSLQIKILESTSVIFLSMIKATATTIGDTNFVLKIEIKHLLIVMSWTYKIKYLN